MKTVSNDATIPHKSVSKKRILIVEDQFIEAHDLQLILEKANYEVTGIARSVEQALEQIESEKPDLVFLDIMLKGTRNGIELAQILKEKHIGFIFISANSSKSILDQAKTTQPYGFIVKPFREQDVLTTLEIAFYRQEYSLESKLMQQLQLQNGINEIVNSDLKWEEALLALAKKIQSFISFDYLEVGFLNTVNYDNLGIMRKNVDDYQIINPEKLSKIADVSVKELNETYKKSKPDVKPIVYSEESLINNFQEAPIKSLIAHNFGIKSYLVFPITIASVQRFYFTFYSRNFNIYSDENLKLLSNLENNLLQFISKANSGEVLNVDEKAKKETASKNSNSEKRTIGDRKSVV